TLNSLRTPDAIQAATGHSCSCSLFLTNDLIFLRIPGLPVVLLNDVLRSSRARLLRTPIPRSQPEARAEAREHSDCSTVNGEFGARGLARVRQGSDDRSGIRGDPPLDPPGLPLRHRKRDPIHRRADASPAESEITRGPKEK